MAFDSMSLSPLGLQSIPTEAKNNSLIWNLLLVHVLADTKRSCRRLFEVCEVLGYNDLKLCFSVVLFNAILVRHEWVGKLSVYSERKMGKVLPQHMNVTLLCLVHVSCSLPWHSTEWNLVKCMCLPGYKIREE